MTSNISKIHYRMTRCLKMSMNFQEPLRPSRRRSNSRFTERAARSATLDTTSTIEGSVSSTTTSPLGFSMIRRRQCLSPPPRCPFASLKTTDTVRICVENLPTANCSRRSTQSRIPSANVTFIFVTLIRMIVLLLCDPSRFAKLPVASRSFLKHTSAAEFSQRQERAVIPNLGPKGDPQRRT